MTGDLSWQVVYDLRWQVVGDLRWQVDIAGAEVVSDLLAVVGEGDPGLVVGQHVVVPGEPLEGAGQRKRRDGGG